MSDFPSPPSAATPSSSQSGGKRILIIEDERSLSNALHLKLKHDGYEVMIAEDGEEAMQMVKEYEYDLILLDIIMPKMDGFTVLEELKAQSKTGTPVFVLSNLGSPEDMEKAKTLGAQEFLVKANSPFVLIMKKIREVLL